LLGRPQSSEPTEVTKAAEAYEFFLQQSGPLVVPCLRAVVYRATFERMMLRVDTQPVVRHLEALASTAPHVRLVVLDSWWGREKTVKAVEDDLGMFLMIGRGIKRTLLEIGITRSWRIFPALKERDREWLLRSAKTSTDAAQALEWVENGV
jgi:hypothetical protein